MSREVVANGIVTCSGQVLLGKKEEVEDHPISDEWHFPGGHIEEGEEPEKTVKREIEEETGLKVTVHQLVGATTGTWREEESPLRLIFHCEAQHQDAEAADDLVDVKWVSPNKVLEETESEADMIKERKNIDNFLHKLERTPVL